MGATTKLSFEEFRTLQEAAADDLRYELDEGELILTPSPTPRHNIVRYRLRRALTDFVQANDLGLVLDETDFRLLANAVRKPDVAFVAKDRMKDFDLDSTPIEGAPTLAVEVISQSNLAQDTAKKVRQYLAAGSHAVWLIYPALRLVEIHDKTGMHEVAEPGTINEQKMFAGAKFSVSLVTLFEDNPRR